MKLDEIDKKIQKTKDRWLVWIGYILNEDDDNREIEYYGKFASSKNGAIGAAKLLLDNTSPYRIIIQDTKPFKDGSKEYQSDLTDFFKLELEE